MTGIDVGPLIGNAKIGTVLGSLNGSKCHNAMTETVLGPLNGSACCNAITETGLLSAEWQRLPPFNDIYVLEVC